jgi:hypothetical protein
MPMSLADLPRVKPILRNDTGVKTYTPVSYSENLPKIFRLNGRPYNLGRHFAMEPVFTTPLPEVLTIASGRQVSKTTVISARQIAIATSVPNLDFMTVTPLFEQIRNISSNVVARFIDESPLKNRWLGARPLRNVLQRSFANGSNLYFSYAGTSADRVRGKSIDIINYDEAQDIDYGLISVVNETMSASEAWESVAYTGTHKTLTTTLQYAWGRSSQARWIIPCQNAGCNKKNICDEFHLVRMLGGYSSDISTKNPGTVCAYCRKTVFPHRGWWEHAIPSLRYRRPGYHIPQVIMPMHYGNHRKWRSLLNKFDGKQGYNRARFLNEVMGLAYDKSTSLVSQSDLAKASKIDWKGSDLEKALASRFNYSCLLISVDWSGGGTSLTEEKIMSLTAVSVMGINELTGKVETIYGKKLQASADSFGEARFIRDLYNQFECDFLVHDYTGAGAQRESFLIQAGIPHERIWPCKFVPPTRGPAVRCVLGTPQHPRVVWHVEKTRCIQVACAAIKADRVNFFKNDYNGEDDPGIIADFLALVEHKIQTIRAGETYTIRRDPNRSDDFAMAVCMGATALWHINQCWPDFGVNMDSNDSELARDGQDYEDVLASIIDTIN